MRPPVVLVADDFDDNREMYGEFLEHAGFRVIQARDGERVVAIARERRPSAILMDLSLPVVDGWEATRILKDDPKTSSIAIVIVTGHTEPESRERAEAAGCDVFFTKPCLPSDIARAIKECLDVATRRSR